MSGRDTMSTTPFNQNILNTRSNKMLATDNAREKKENEYPPISVPDILRVPHSEKQSMLLPSNLRQWNWRECHIETNQYLI